MKKFFMIFLLLIMVLSFSVQVAAAPLKAAASSGTAVIDGVNTDGEWDGDASYPVDKFKESTGTPGTTKGTYKVKWDGSSLYVFVEIQDNSVSKSGETDKQDNIQVYIEYDNSGSGHYNDPFEKEYQFLINRSGNYNQYDCIPFDLNNNIEVSVKSSDESYTIEFKLNLANIAGETVPAGKEIGFDIQINDFKGSERLAAYAWNDETDNAWMNVSYLGKLALSEEKPGETDPQETLGNTPENTEHQATPAGSAEHTAGKTAGSADNSTGDIKPAKNGWIIISVIAAIVICAALIFIFIRRGKERK